MFDSRSGLNFFQALFLNCFDLHLLKMYFPQYKYMSFICYYSRLLMSSLHRIVFRFRDYITREHTLTFEITFTQHPYLKYSKFLCWYNSVKNQTVLAFATLSSIKEYLSIFYVRSCSYLLGSFLAPSNISKSLPGVLSSPFTPCSIAALSDSCDPPFTAFLLASWMSRSLI